MMNKILFEPIGYIHSEYEDVNQMPKSSTESYDKTAELIVDEKYLESMSDIKKDEEYMIIFYFHKSEGFKQKVRIRGTGPITGLFSTHAPNRPNPIGVSTIKIKDVKDNIITFNGVDMLNNTPVLDIKKIFK
ncbi:MAG: SAM-dependent methyltransferase [Methanosphaera sp.]|uniref:SAM-dependent methyltransferase n=1 Tax=Methanosphaera sp. ISO3-F5 TaxID=1452353 RepID=UPI002B25F4E4|nr:SAM-dependent methyltransferase [Methanosphaera sp. ISO3-F5]MBR0472462.1 SAM-dependent methyltransferase [Methanosphaera sp.]WQH63814.1 SAM-dependent methyltransferase [Methanosphaera sp. ISO3-F5]